MKHRFSDLCSLISGVIARSGLLLSFVGVCLLVGAAFVATAGDAPQFSRGTPCTTDAPVLTSAEQDTGAHAEVSVVSGSSVRHAIGSNSFRRSPVRKVMLLVDCLLLAAVFGFVAGRAAAFGKPSHLAFRFQTFLKTAFPVRAGPARA